MEKLEAAVTAYDAATAALLGEVAATLEARQHLRRMDTNGLLAHAERRAGFNAAIGGLLGQAATLLKAACGEAQAGAETLEALEAALRGAALPLRQAVDRARAAARTLAGVDAFDRDVTTRALAMVRAASGRLPTAGAVYGRRGAPQEAAVGPTSSSSA